MSKHTIPKDDSGVTIRILTGLDLTGNTALKMRYSKHDETVVEKTATVNGAEADGEVEYTDVAADAIWDTTGDVRVVCQVSYTNKRRTSFPPLRVAVSEEFES